MNPQRKTSRAGFHAEKLVTPQLDANAPLLDNASLEEAPALAITHYLRRMLEQYEESEFIKYLIAPSQNKLVRIFGCAEADVNEALQELEREGYYIELSGHDDPIVLSDPLIREQTVRRNDPDTWPLSFQNVVH